MEAIQLGLEKSGKSSGIPVSAAFKRGSTLADWAPGGSQWPQLQSQLATHPSHVLVELGTNDAMHNASPAQVQERTQALVNAIRKAGAEPVFALPNHQDVAEGSADKVRATMQDVLGRNGVKVIKPPSKDLVPMAPGGGGVHSNPSGYRNWASAIWSGLTTNSPG